MRIVLAATSTTSKYAGDTDKEPHPGLFLVALLDCTGLADCVKLMAMAELSKQEEAQLELGRKMQAVFDMGYFSRKDALKWSFLKGLATGLGAFVGGTIVIAVLIWVVSRFNSFPLVGPVTQQVQETLQRDKN